MQILSSLGVQGGYKLKETMIILYLLSISMMLFAQENSESNKILAKDFEKAVILEVDKRVKRVRGLNISDLTRDLLKKEAGLNEREESLREEKRQLKIISQDFTEKVKKFGDQQKKLLGCLDENEKKKSERIDRLVGIVQGMKPKKAAELLAIQEAGLAVRILNGLKPEKSSEIFNIMDREISARLQKQYLIMK